MSVKHEVLERVKETLFEMGLAVADPTNGQIERLIGITIVSGKNVAELTGEVVGLIKDNQELFENNKLADVAEKAVEIKKNDSHKPVDKCYEEAEKIITDHINQSTESDGGKPDGIGKDSSEPDGDDTDSSEPDGDDTDTSEPDGDDTDTSEPDGDDTDTSEPNGDDTDTNEPDGDDTDTSEPDGDDTDTSEPDGDTDRQ